jgi:hypothetical protein
MELESLPLVTFGKYKGQPVTTLLADTAYLEWCKTQDFFKKHTTVYNICVNQTIQSNQSSKTPEHNKLQNLFLNREFSLKFTKYLTGCSELENELENLYCTEEYKKYFGDQQFDIDFSFEKLIFIPKFETDFNWDVNLKVEGNSNSILFDEMLLPNFKLNNDTNFDYAFASIKKDIPYLHEKCMLDGTFREKKYGVKCSFDFNVICYIEIKPLLGDDYPNVLRKMTTQIKLTKSSSQYKYDKKWILLIGEYSSTVTTKKELIQIFKFSEIKVVFVEDISNGLLCKQLEENLLKKIKQLEEKNNQLEEKVKQLELIQSK